MKQSLICVLKFFIILKILFRLKEWEKEINEIDIDSTKLLVENEVDLEGPPRQMTYINAYKPSDGIVIPDDPPLGKKFALKNFETWPASTIYIFTSMNYFFPFF